MLYQKRFKKEKENRRRLQEQLDQEMKRKNQLEEAIKTSSNSEVLRLLNGKWFYLCLSYFKILLAVIDDKWSEFTVRYSV